MELHALQSVASIETFRRFAVIGSGPLPLTSLCILEAFKQKEYGSACIHNIDSDPVAVSQSSEVCCRLGHTEQAMSFQHADPIVGSLSLSRFDVVYLAALAGTCYEQKSKIIASIVRTMQPGALLVLRTAHSLRGLLYPVSN